MRRKRITLLTIWLIFWWLFIPVITEAVDERPPICNDAPKAGVVELHPNGTANAMEQVIFTVPFCTDNLIALATVRNSNTAGERVGIMPMGVTAVNVSIALDEPSEDSYFVYWRVGVASQ